MSPLLFTDLDGTILFSRRTLPAGLPLEDCVEAETYSNGAHGYMQRDLVGYLREWSQHHLLIPVTTRSLEQFSRLSPLLSSFNMPFALASNGGNLYREGRLDPRWKQAVVSELAPQLKNRDAALEIIEQMIPGEDIRKVKDIDQLYYCVLVVEREWPAAHVEAVNRLLAQIGWVAYFQHKKLYFLPMGLTKEAAARRLLQELPQRADYVAMGDTDMDWQLLLNSRDYLYFGEQPPCAGGPTPSQSAGKDSPSYDASNQLQQGLKHVSQDEAGRGSLQVSDYSLEKIQALLSPPSG